MCTPNKLYFNSMLHDLLISDRRGQPGVNNDGQRCCEPGLRPRARESSSQPGLYVVSKRISPKSLLIGSSPHRGHPPPRPQRRQPAFAVQGATSVLLPLHRSRPFWQIDIRPYAPRNCRPLLPGHTLHHFPGYFELFDGLKTH